MVRELPREPAMFQIGLQGEVLTLVNTNFGGNSYGPIIGPYLFLGKFVWTDGPETSSKVSPYTGIGPWMAFPSILEAEPLQRRKGKTSRDEWPVDR